MEREAVIMNDKKILLDKIDRASLISFDVFDTLLFRKVNTPETVFDLVGKHFNIPGFRKLRMDEQNEASRRAYAEFQYPHADMDQIYAVLSEHTEISVDWNEVKEYEIQMERDALVANTEMLEIFNYAKAQGKRVIATSDMYLPARILSEILEENGFTGFGYVYCSADEHKAKFNRDLFEIVAQKEGVPFGDILHIGDKERDDGEFPAAYGMDTFVYHRAADMEKLKNASGSDVDEGIYKILCDGSKGFWYELGVEVGGPLYMGLFRWLLEKTAKSGKKIFFLSRDGYNLCHIFREYGFENVEYLYTSRRALTMAALTDMNEKDIASMPPYSYGHTIGEILDYMRVDRTAVKHLSDIGFDSYDCVIKDEDDAERFRKIYPLDKEAFLTQAAVERENALKYFNSIGFLDEDAICFDCGWQGSSQELLERFKAAVGCKTKHFFYYFGIKNGKKSRKQLQRMHYDTYLFDFYKNYALQDDMRLNVAMYELFFSAPHESVYYYDEDGEVVFEQGSSACEKDELLRGISDFIRTGMEFVEKYDVEYTPELAVRHLKRLIHLPTEEEAVTIGNLQNVDSFARKQGEAKYIAHITSEQLANNANTEIYWLNGLLKRPDISEELKKDCALRLGVQYPPVVSEYHLEDDLSIMNYKRWIRQTAKQRQVFEELAYKPTFSVVIPVYNTVTEQLEECFQSVLAQNYDCFELILVDDHSSWDNVRPVLRRYENHEKVRVIYRETNGHISVATNDGIRIASGDFIVFMDCDDVIEPTALYEFARKLNENPELDFIYSDEDKITEDGKIRHMPFFKPDWSPDLFMNMMYTNHLATYRASIVKSVGGLRTAFNGSQDYDFTLRFMEKSDNKRVGHISKVLYHWRERRESVAFAMSSKNYAAIAARNAKEDYIRRNGLKAHLEPITGMNQYRTVYEVTGDPLVSIIIPSKDHPDILELCICTIIEYTDYKNYEIVVVDNGSNEINRRRTELFLEAVGAKYIYDEAPFNFSKMCNTGAANASGEYLLFLNDDIEIFQPQWLERMLGHAQQPHTGAVGAKLFYPCSTKIQHTGVSNVRGGPIHSLFQLDDQSPYYFGWNWVDNNSIGVTGACLLLARDKFEKAGRFDENLAVAYNDVKLCFALHDMGYYNVVRNDAVAYHHESFSRGNDHAEDGKLVRLGTERTRMIARFPYLYNRDPFLNENLEVLSASLKPKLCCDEFAPVDLTGCEEAKYATVDTVTIQDRVHIVGWSMLFDVESVDQIEQYVVFEDPFGRTYAASTCKAQRMDVVSYFNDERLRYAGFECVLDKADLRVDIMRYRCGVLMVTADGRRFLRWGEKTPIIRNPKTRPLPAEFVKLDSYQPQENVEGITWYLDECCQKESYFYLRGFAFKNGDVHYLYEKSIVLVDSSGTAYEYEVLPEERVDLAYVFVSEHFLFYAGFECFLYNAQLKPGEEYEVFIRLKNRHNPSEVYDMRTDGRICLQ